MLESIRTIIQDIPDMSFAEYYQRYIFMVQDRNIAAEIKSIKTDNVLSLARLIDRLSKEHIF